MYYNYINVLLYIVQLISSILFRWTTRIVLPLKSDITVSQNMMSKFQDIQPSLLLFLNRLRCIIIEDTVSELFNVQL